MMRRNDAPSTSSGRTRGLHEMTSTVFMADSALDSNRFGIKVARCQIPAGAFVDDIVSAVIASEASLIILRTDAGNTSALVRLLQLGWPVIHADSLVYYGVDLTTLTREPSTKDVRLATQTDQEAIQEIAECGFAGYRSHYAANPLLPQKEILAGYVEWAKSRLTPGSLESCTWVVTTEGQVAGFATCDSAADKSKVEIVLNAIHPQFSRRGLYGRLLRGILRHYADQSYQRLVISTQLWNYTVQRQWARAGLTMERAYDTYHIDRRLRTQDNQV